MAETPTPTAGADIARGRPCGDAFAQFFHRKSCGKTTDTQDKGLPRCYRGRGSAEVQTLRRPSFLPPTGGGMPGAFAFSKTPLFVLFAVHLHVSCRHPSALLFLDWGRSPAARNAGRMSKHHPTDPSRIRVLVPRPSRTPRELTLAREGQWLFHLRTITRQACAGLAGGEGALTDDAVQAWFEQQQAYWQVLLGWVGLSASQIPDPESPPESLQVFGGAAPFMARRLEAEVAFRLWTASAIRVAGHPTRQHQFRHALLERRDYFLRHTPDGQHGDLVRNYMAAWWDLGTGADVVVALGNASRP